MAVTAYKSESRRLRVKPQVCALAAGGCAAALFTPADAFAFASAEFAIKEICAHMQGDLGALLMTTAGVGAIVAAAFGNFRASHSFIITAIGAVTISAMLSLYFGQAGSMCEGASSRNPSVPGGRTLNPALNANAVGRTNNPAAQARGGIGSAELAIATGGEVDFSGAAHPPVAEEAADEFEEGLLDFDHDLRDQNADLF